MTIKYPNGRLQHHHKGNQRLRQPIQHGNRGQQLESLINDSNTYYLTREIAVIHKTHSRSNCKCRLSKTKCGDN